MTIGLHPPNELRLVGGSRAHKRVIRSGVGAARPGTAVAFKNFGDSLLDYIEAGPKLRKWYGEGERRPRDGGEPGPEDEQEREVGPADSILVTDADSPTGELVLLQLILARLRVTALVRDSVATQHAYGDYVQPIQGRVGDASSMSRALGTAKAVVCPTALGCLPALLPKSRISHAVLLASAGDGRPGPLGGLFGGEQAVLADPRREAAFASSSVPLTVVRVGRIVDAPGGAGELSFSQGAPADAGEISREDVAQVLVRALQRPPRSSLAFAVASRRTGRATQWDRLFTSVREA